MKKTIVLGASTNPARYAYRAIEQLLAKGHEAVPLGIREGTVKGISILPLQESPTIDQVDTITLYLRPEHQKHYYDYLLSLKPKRIIFNPGTENPELVQIAKKAGIEVTIACTLVLLSIGDY